MPQQDRTETHEFSPRRTPRSDIVDILPTELDQIKKATLTAVFIPEAWVNDIAKEVDQPREEFTVPLYDIYRDTPLRDEYDDTWAIHATTSSHHLPDAMQSNPQLPIKYQNWHGPFEIRVKEVSVPSESATENDTSVDGNTYIEFGRGAGLPEIEAQLPTAESVIENSEAILLFIGQKWQNDYATDVDGGTNTFSVPLQDLYKPDRSGDDQWLISGSNHNHYVADGLGQHENNDDRYRNWTDRDDGEYCYIVKLQAIHLNKN